MSAVSYGFRPRPRDLPGPVEPLVEVWPTERARFARCLRPDCMAQPPRPLKKSLPVTQAYQHTAQQSPRLNDPQQRAGVGGEASPGAKRAGAAADQDGGAEATRGTVKKPKTFLRECCTALQRYRGVRESLTLSSCFPAFNAFAPSPAASKHASIASAAAAPGASTTPQLRRLPPPPPRATSPRADPVKNRVRADADLKERDATRGNAVPGSSKDLQPKERELKGESARQRSEQP